MSNEVAASSSQNIMDNQLSHSDEVAKDVNNNDEILQQSCGTCHFFRSSTNFSRGILPVCKPVKMSAPYTFLAEFSKFYHRPHPGMYDLYINFYIAIDWFSSLQLQQEHM